VLNYASIVFMIREYKDRLMGPLPSRFIIAGVVFGLHMIFSIGLWMSYVLFLFSASASVF
jgi:hypothetical protein